ncbi:hypothetical protein [Kineosporia babensis]|uniref:WXG100 family type VII secretion target n=1 Tax=Kineosporia babensis TaxID=499548 RepID=A0A9X1NAH6_9ACTN|nr:hypothetical protein [Kineosporia babensis]MCD5310304.1 hypothetical protein [Kineosporia babensis]
MSGYSYSPTGGQDTMAELQQVTARMRDLLDQLQASAQAFMNANEGEAPGNYSLAQSEWNAGHQAMEQAMNKGIVALQNIHNEILNGDRQGAAQFM